MNDPDVRSEFKTAGNDADATASAITDYLRFASAPPLAVLLLERARFALVQAGNAIGDMLTPDDAPAEVPPSHVEAKRSKASGEHRHKFGPDGKCTTCGKVKSANGRKPSMGGAAAVAELLAPDTRTMRLPIAPLGDAAADRFSDGGQGSSMVRR